MNGQVQDPEAEHRHIVTTLRGGGTLNGDPGMGCSANLMLMSYSPASVGMYSTVQDPSRLSLQVILASDGPSMASPRPPVPAPGSNSCFASHQTAVTCHSLPLVSTVKVLGWLTTPYSRPGPKARTFFGSHPRRTLTVNGDPGTAIPS